MSVVANGAYDSPNSTLSFRTERGLEDGASKDHSDDDDDGLVQTEETTLLGRNRNTDNRESRLGCNNTATYSYEDSLSVIGMMVGGYFWGTLADRSGRRSILMWSLTINGLGGLLSSVSQVFWLFLLFRFISGVGVGGSIPVIFTYFTEFQAKARRGTMISILATFWMAGNIIAAGLAWLVIPHSSLGYFSPEFTYNSWRIFVALCTIPSLTSAAAFVLMPESPKFLLSKGKEVEAIGVLKRIHHSNSSFTQFNISSLVVTTECPERREEEALVGLTDSVTSVQPAPACCQVTDLVQNTLQLFQPSLRRRTILLLLINFCISFGYYGLFMWFPEIFHRIDVNGGTLCELQGERNQSSSVPLECDKVGQTVYLEGFLTAVSNLPGNLLTILLMDRIGRKALLASSMVVSGVSVFFLWFVRERWQNLLMSCLFGAVSTIGFNALDVLQTELFPTHIRSTAFGVQTAFMRIAAILGNVTFGLLVDVHCAIPMILVAVLMSLGGLVSLLLPSTTGLDIH